MYTGSRKFDSFVTPFEKFIYGIEVKDDGLNHIQFGIKLPFSPLEKIFETSHIAEELNFDSVWSPDHLLSLNLHDWSAYSVWSVLAAVARETSRCIIGTSVTDCFRLGTGVLAQTAMTLQNMSNGRFILGIGMGEAQNIKPYGINYDRKVSRLRETVVSLKQLWQGELVSYRGEFVALDRATIRPKPLHPIPVWIAANSPKTIKLTGEIGDGWLPLAVRFPPEKYAESLDIIKSHAKNFSNFTPALFIHTLCDKNGENAWRRAMEGGKLMLVMWTPEIFEKHGHIIEPVFHADRLVFDDRTVDMLKKKLKQLPDEPVYQCLTVGNPDDCISSLEKYVKAGVRHFVLSFLTPVDQLAESIKFYRKNVISYFWDR